MIWQLLKRDATWKWTPLVAALALPPAAHPRVVESIIFMNLVFVGPRAPIRLRTTAQYESALPISARDLWLSRVLSKLASMWIAVLAVFAVQLAMGHHPSLTLAEAVAMCSVIVLAVKCVRHADFAPQKWSWIVAGAVIPELALWCVPVDRWLTLPAGIVFAGCGGAGAALLLTGWLTAPKSFQIAAGSIRQMDTKVPSRLIWSPVLRPLYREQLRVAIVIVPLFAIGLLGPALVGLVFSWAFVWFQARWLFSLPVPSRTLFAVMAIPPTAALIAGFAANIFLVANHPPAPKLGIVEVGVELLLLYVLILLQELTGWWWTSKFSTFVRGAPLMLLALPVVLSLFATPAFTPNSGANFDAWFRRLAALLPQDWLPLIAVLFISIAAIYCLAEKLFGQMEYPFARPTGQLSGEASPSRRSSAESARPIRGAR